MDLLELEKKYSLEIIKEEGLKPVRIRVKKDDDIVFQYFMDTKVGDSWVVRKEVTVLESNHSSLYVYEHSDDYSYMINNDDYAVCGGGFPLIINNEVRGVFVISGLEHTEDHDLIIRALDKLK